MRRLLIFSVAVSSDGIQPVRTHSLIPVFVPTSVVNWYKINFSNLVYFQSASYMNF